MKISIKAEILKMHMDKHQLDNFVLDFQRQILYLLSERNIQSKRKHLNIHGLDTDDFSII